MYIMNTARHFTMDSRVYLTFTECITQYGSTVYIGIAMGGPAL